MNCHFCGAAMQPMRTDLPFKRGDASIIIIKQLPVLQCQGCREFLIEDAVMAKVESILARADRSADLEVIPFAA